MRKECPAKHPGTKCSTRVPRRSVTVRRATRQDIKCTQWDRRRAAPVLPATRPARRPERTQNRRPERAQSRSTKLGFGKSRLTRRLFFWCHDCSGSWREFSYRIPGALRHEMTLRRTATHKRTPMDPGSALHRFALHRVRDKRSTHTPRLRARPAQPRRWRRRLKRLRRQPPDARQCQSTSP